MFLLLLEVGRTCANWEMQTHAFRISCGVVNIELTCCKFISTTLYYSHVLLHCLYHHLLTIVYYNLSSATLLHQVMPLFYNY